MKNRCKDTFSKGVVMLAVMTALMSGCIENDVPFEIIPGDIVEMKIEGSESLIIDNENLVIDLVLADTVDLRRVLLDDFNITSDAKIEDNMTGEIMDTLDSYYLDLTQGGGAENYFIPDTEESPYVFTVITYQYYEWKLKAKQNVAREFNLAGGVQIGESTFSGNEYSVAALVPLDVDLASIKIADLKLGPSNSTLAWVSPDGSVVENVDYKSMEFDFAGKEQHFIVKFFDITQQWTVSVTQSANNVTSLLVDSWAKYARMSTQGQTSAGTPGFEIRKVGDQEWTAVDDVVVDGGSFSGMATGLTPTTDYETRGFIDKGQGSIDYGDVVAFTTEAIVSIPNLDFEGWEKVDIKDTKGIESPNAPGEPLFWTTGNEGSMFVLFGLGLKKNITIPVTGAMTRSGEGTAVQMKSYYVNIIGVTSLASGTIYTGNFGPMSGAPANPDAQRALVSYGQPYASRPKALKGWYRYIPQPINVAIMDNGKAGINPKFVDMMGQEDNCKIYISLEAWGEGVTVRPKSPLVVGYGKIQTGATEVVTTNNGYVPFEFDVDYTSTQKPDHIVMGATCCALSDDFCGAGAIIDSGGNVTKLGSELYIDDFELVWE